MKVYNPTGWDIEAHADGIEHLIPAFSEYEVFETEHFKILMKNSRHLGLVHCVYNDQMKKKYKTYEEFKHAQAEDGLKCLQAWVKEVYINERQAEVDVKHKAGSEADKDLINSNPFKARVAEVDKWVEELKSSSPEKTEEKAPVKRGRRKKVEDGSLDYQNQGAS